MLMSHVDGLPDPNAVVGRRADNFKALPDGLKPLSHHTTSDHLLTGLVSTLDVFPDVQHRGPARRDRALEVYTANRRSPRDTRRQLRTKDTT